MRAARQQTTTVMSTKGQVILPKAVRDRLGWAAGTRLVVESTPDGAMLRPVSPFPPTTIDRVAGSLPYAGPARTIEDMDAAVAAEAKRRARR